MVQSKSLCEFILSNSRDKNDEHKNQSYPIDKYYNEKMTIVPNNLDKQIFSLRSIKINTYKKRVHKSAVFRALSFLLQEHTPVIFVNDRLTSIEPQWQQ